MSTRPFEGSVVVVTGGAAGIGKAVAQAFVAEGAVVAVLDRDLSDAPKGVTALQADVTSDANYGLNTSYLKTAESELCVIAAKAHPSP